MASQTRPGAFVGTCLCGVLALGLNWPAHAGCSGHGGVVAPVVGIAGSARRDTITLLTGEALTVAATDPTPWAIGIDGGAQDDILLNFGAISVAATSNLSSTTAQGVPATLGAAGHPGSPCGDALPAVLAVGMLGGEGNDEITNAGTMTVEAANAAGGQSVQAVGLRGDNGDDTITNTGTLTVTASATAPLLAAAPAAAAQTSLATQSGTAASSHEQRDNASTLTGVLAVGIEGGNGKDTLRNDGTLIVNASSSLTNITPSLTLIGGEAVTATTTVESSAVGISAGSGKDEIANNGDLTATATSTITGINAELNLIDTSHGDTSTYVRSHATGIDAGNSNDDISLGNTGTVTADAHSTSTAVNVELNAVDAATGDSSLNVDSTATGIVTGRGTDTLTNAGAINATATSTVTDVGVNASFVDATIADRQGSDVSTALHATATGIDGTAGKTDIDVLAGGAVNATATSTVHSVGVALASEGVPQATETLINDHSLASIGITSSSAATAIGGGDSKDHVTSLGDITASATSTATQDSANVGIAVFDFKIPTPGLVLGGAGTAANADAWGIDAGGGDDDVLSGGLVQADASATAWARAYSINIAEFSVDLAPSVPGIPFGASLVVADTSSTATANTTGIAGGAGNDTIRNTGTVDARATASGGALSIAGTTDIKFGRDASGGGENFFAVDAVAARGVSEATSTAFGIDGGAGFNTLFNDGGMSVAATSTGRAISVGVDVSGTVTGNGGALGLTATDTSATATADATGLRGGDQHDVLNNTGSMGVTATATAAGGNGALTVGVAEKGAVVGGALSRSTMHATATSIGIDGGGGVNDIANTKGSDDATGISATAIADADSFGLSATIEGTTRGVAGGVAMVQVGTEATATATGIASGTADQGDGSDYKQDHGKNDPRDGYDHSDASDHGSRHDCCEKGAGTITNANALNVEAQAHTHSTSVGVKVGIAEKGLAAGAALADSHATANATATGIQTGARDDEIDNESSIGLMTDAGAQAVSVALTVEGTTAGAAGGAALVNAGVGAISNAAGIRSGDGSDTVFNRGSISASQLKAKATAVGIAPSVFVAEKGAAIGGALANTRAEASASAFGMDGGAGGDMLANLNSIDLQNVAADADAVSITLGVSVAQNGLAAGGALANGDSLAHANVFGVNGGSGDDVLFSTGDVGLQHIIADANAVSVSVELAGAQNGVSLGAALVNATSNSDATAVGLAGGDGRDALINKGTVTLNDVKTDGDSTGVGVGFTFAQQGLAVAAALANNQTIANTKASGLDGGAGDDFVLNKNEIKLQQIKASADAVSVSVGLAAADSGVAIGAGLTNASGTADTTVSGMSGGAGRDKLINAGSILGQDIGADAFATGVSVELAGVNAGVGGGFTIANTNGIAHTTAAGMDGGADDDVLLNTNSITLGQVGTRAYSTSVGVSINAALTGGVSAGAALSNAGAEADTTVSGMTGGSGNDLVTNKGTVTADGIQARTIGTSVSVEIGATNAGVAIGGAVALTNGKSTDSVAGLAGADGDDQIFNGGDIALRNLKADSNAVNVAASINAVISGGVALGGAYVDGSAVSTLYASGIDGGAGNDTIVNQGSIKVENAEAHAQATGVAGSVQVSLAGGAGSLLVADTSGTAKTFVKGIDGGSGDDQIGNAGTVDVKGTANAGATSVAVGVNVALGVGLGGTMTNADTRAESTVMGIDGGDGHDVIRNDGSIDANADAHSTAASVSVGITVAVGGDATAADAQSIANATSVGINTGADRATDDHGDHDKSHHPSKDGHDGKHDPAGKHHEVDGHHHGDKTPVTLIDNTGAITSTATATAKGGGASVNLLGYALGKTTNTADAAAFGIRGGASRDQISNSGTITAAGSASATGLAISAQLAGKALGDASTTATGGATAIDSGEGDDVIMNLAGLEVGAHADAGGKTVTVGLIGVSEGDASTTSTATALGIDGGAGDDAIVNRASITVSAGDPTATDTPSSCMVTTSGACAKTSSISVNLGGLGKLNASTNANATAGGIAGGAGNDAIDSDGAIAVNARAMVGASSVNVGIFGAQSTDLQTISEADATGIQGDDGNDRITAAGSVNAASGSRIGLSGTGFTLGGAGSFDATLNANARAAAIDGGSGRDEIENHAALNAAGTAALSSSSGSNVVFGASSADANSGANADAAAIRAGADNDKVWNYGAIGGTATATLSLGSSSFSFGGAGGADGTLNADARGAGIAGESGDDILYNEGSVTVAAFSTLSSSGGSTVVFGASSAGASSGAYTDAVGIAGGDDADAVWNKGIIISGSTATLTLDSSSFNFGGAGGAKGALLASTYSAGIGGGSGADGILNDGELDVDATSSLSSGGGSTVVFGASSAGADSGATTDAVGIDAGADDDFVWNRAHVASTSTATLSLDKGSFTFGGAGGTQGTLSASTRSVGLEGGSGNDRVKNQGTVSVNSTSTLTAKGGSTVAFGASGATSTSGAFTRAIGIDGGDGDNGIWNAAAIDVHSSATLTMSGSSYTFGGTGDVSGRLSAGTDSVGILAGNGMDVIGNHADIDVGATSNLTSSGKVNTTFGTSASGAVATTDTAATGIDAGDGNDRVENDATITVATHATATSSNSSYVFGGTTSSGATVQAASRSVGIAGGGGDDWLSNAGEIDVSTNSSITGVGSAYAEFGGASASGLVTADAVSTGIDGGDGNDTVLNQGIVRLTGLAEASSSHRTDTGFLFGGGDSYARSGSTITGYGVDVGGGDNTMQNDGEIWLALAANASASTSSDGADIFDGDAYSRSDTTASATGIGIRAGDGNNTVSNNGLLNVTTSSTLPTHALASAYADGDGIDGDGTARAYATTTAWAAGIAAGSSVGVGANDITNSGTITVNAIGSATATATADADAGGTASTTRVATVKAYGYGIYSGAGNDVVRNTGTINVTTAASNNTGAGDITAVAAGIATGDGDDTIVNEGSISATRIVNGSATRGIAIDAGGGNDTVELRDGSVTNGDIELGTGSDTLSLSGTPVINGTIHDALSTVTLLFNNTGSYSGGLPGVTAIKQGDGTFSLSMLNPMERIDVQQGTLQLNNDYQFMSGGEFDATVYGGGSHGQFQVVGETALGGKLKIARGHGAYVDGMTFDVLAASKGITQGSTFASIELPQPTRLLKFDAQQLADAVRVRADVASFTTVAGAGNEMKVARHLDAILPRVSGGLSDTLGQVQTLSDGQFATAFSSLSPAAYGDYSMASSYTMRAYIGAVQDRMTAARAGELASRGGSGDREPIRLAASDASLRGLLADRDKEMAGNIYGVWIKAFHQHGDQDADNGFNGYNYRVNGATIGFDQRFSRTLMAGLTLGYAKNKVQAELDASDGDIESNMGSIYGNYFKDNLYVNGVLSFGQNRYDTNRNVTIGATSTTVTSKHDGTVFAASVGGGYYFKPGAWWLDPFAYLQYTRLREDGFQESGGGASLIVDARTTDALVSTLGVRASRIYDTDGGGKWIPELSLAWLHDYGIDGHSISASYVGAPDSTFSIDGQPIKHNGVVLGLGVTHRSQSGFTTLIRYNGEFRDKFKANSIIGELRYEF